ncbi:MULTISPECIES: hypothetical protein [unclassified Modicisalibacter]|uniref:hypothetical protein n=1 Tax=unclassified Modicisalibacter TaxID=2679913 RepID=UPI001CCC0E3E|nr:MULTISPECIES: hypothetical protein [unclassified Modicisalibacter]MBZ9556798.1 hypothetical protein [Modicisalibacter sp. R2A 31.J]MBZ9574731.1 hypothetical protein [Modicisalibacter sp. MOD 31.J]
MKKFMLILLGVLGLGHAHADQILDYSKVDSREKAMELAREGKLQKILLFPSELGGEDIPQNVVYVPPGISEIKDSITGTLFRFAKEGVIDSLQVNPEYKGVSVIPSRIHIKTSHSGKPGEFNPTIDIW